MSSFTRPYARAFVEAAPKGYDFGAFLEAGDAMAHAVETNPTLRAFMLRPERPAGGEEAGHRGSSPGRPASTRTGRDSSS